MKRTAGRPIGERIREVLTIAEQMGGATATQIRLRMNGPMEASNASKYCSRAVGLQLMTVTREAKPMVYRPVQGWRELIEECHDFKVLPEEPRPTAADTVAAALRSQPNSVFALGTRP